MAKKTNIYKFDIIERVISECEVNSKEEILIFAQKMRDIAQKNPDYSDTVKQAFVDAYNEIDKELTLENIKEIKKIINANNGN